MTSLSLFTFMHWRRKWQPTPMWVGFSFCLICVLYNQEYFDSICFSFSVPSHLVKGEKKKKNPRDRGAWWAAIYGVAQSRTRLKRLSSSSSSSRSEFSLSIYIPPTPTKYLKQGVVAVNAQLMFLNE